MADKKIERAESAPAAEAAPVSAAEPTASVAATEVRRSLPALAIVGIAVGGLLVAGALFGGGVLVGTQLPGGGPGMSGPMFDDDGMRGPGQNGERPTPPDQRDGAGDDSDTSQG